jgi:hypothetical protein
LKKENKTLKKTTQAENSFITREDLDLRDFVASNPDMK